MLDLHDGFGASMLRGAGGAKPGLGASWMSRMRSFVVPLPSPLAMQTYPGRWATESNALDLARSDLGCRMNILPTCTRPRIKLNPSLSPHAAIPMPRMPETSVRRCSRVKDHFSARLSVDFHFFRHRLQLLARASQCPLITQVEILQLSGATAHLRPWEQM